MQLVASCCDDGVSSGTSGTMEAYLIFDGAWWEDHEDLTGDTRPSGGTYMSPKTGDTSNMLLYGGLVAETLAAITGLIIVKKKKGKK